MPNKTYDNFFLANEIEDQYNSHLDLVQFCTVDNSLTGTAGMDYKVHVYKATDGTEKLTKGEGNTKTIEADFTEKVYKILLAQNRFSYFDEDAMTDPMVVTTGTRHAGVDLFNTQNADISNIQKGIAAVQAYKAVAANAALSASEQAAAMSTASATAAQYGFNAALLSCPLTWVIVGIIAVVAAIYLIVAAINNMTGSAISATGIICGIFAVAASLILNTGIGVYNSFLAIIGTFVNFFLGIIEWVLNAANGGFDSFGGAVANLIGQIISWFLSLGQVVTTIIDAIFGTNWTAGLEDLKGTVTQWGKNDTAITLDRGDYSGIQRIQYSDAWDAGYSFGQGVDSKVSGLFDGFSMDSMGAFDFGNTLERIEQNSGFTAANTAASSKKLDITSEELKYLRDIAEREAINRFTTAEVRIEQTNHNSISKDVDVDGIMDYWADWFAEKLDVSYEGVHG